MQLPRPSKIVCVGLNYVDHANEVALELPERPLLFAKWPNALIGDGDEIVIPKGINNVDYEAELAVIIGRQTRSVGAAEALDSIAAYTCLNDVSAPAGEIEEPSALRIRCRVNGETVQDATIGDMIFGVAELIAYISNGITLEPGDIVATGTPPGVALGRPDGRYLADADTVEVEIDGIGILTNRVRAE